MKKVHIKKIVEMYILGLALWLFPLMIGIVAYAINNSKSITHSAETVIQGYPEMFMVWGLISCVIIIPVVLKSKT